MIEIIAYIIVGIGLIGSIIFYVNRLIATWFEVEIFDEQQVVDTVEQAAEDLEETVEELAENIEQLVDDVKEDVQDALDDLPTVSQLKRMTKDKIIELADKHGIELNKRDTKDTMIKQLKQDDK